MPSREKQIYVAPAPVPVGATATVALLTPAFTAARAAAKTRANNQAACLKADLALYAANPIINALGAPDNAANYNRVQARLLTFEQAYLQERDDWLSIVNGVDPTIAAAPDPAGTTITLSIGGHAAGTIYINDARFQPGPIVSTIQTYQLRDGTLGRGGAPRQYVRVNNGGGTQSYVKRYVVRGLNVADLWAYHSNADLIPAHDTAAASNLNELDPPNASRHPVATVGAAGAGLSTGDQIISHTRGWRKRFISCVPSEREIYSTRGAPFDGNTGVVTLDLVEILAAYNDIHDLHSVAYATTIYGGYVAADIIHAIDPETPPLATRAAPNGYDKQLFRGFRDVIRTREVVIETNVPHGAILAAATGRYILVVGSPTAGGHPRNGNAATIDAAIQAQFLAPGPANAAGLLATVTMNYPLYSKFHTYCVMATQADALAIQNWLEPAPPLPANANAAIIDYVFPLAQLQPA